MSAYALAVATALLLAATPAEAARRRHVGVNTDTVSYHSAPLFCSGFEQRGAWFGVLGATAPVLDADGWPTSWSGGGRMRTHWWTNSNAPGSSAGHFPTGTYTVTCDGVGSLLFDKGSQPNPTTQIECPAGGTFNVPVATEYGITMDVLTSPNTIWGLEVRPAGCAGTYLAEAVEAYRFAAIRFMDWWGPVYKLLGAYDWDDRPRRGGSYENAIMLANTAVADPWFTLPVGATDGFVLGLCALVEATVPAGRRVYAELGDEPWNVGGPFLAQHQALDGMGAAAGLPDPEWRSYYDLRTAKVAALCPRFSPVINIQNATQASVTGARLDADVDGTGPLGRLRDVPNLLVAVALYFGDGINTDPASPGYEGDEALNWTPAEWHAQMREGWAQWLDYAKAHHDAAEARGVETITYEGGPHVRGSLALSPADLLAFTLANNAAQRDVGMEAVYDDWIGVVYGTGIDLFMHYGAPYSVWTKYGPWGAGEGIDTYRDSPKYRALRSAD